ncbi:MAG: hypothetical protein K0Q82_2138 [Chryseobacterium indoltheticum]|jgi:hypothetical protein|nr:hypothetical protein [Chryseobacterium indoltheticum]
MSKKTLAVLILISIILLGFSLIKGLTLVSISLLITVIVFIVMYINKKSF